jgi:integrase
MNMEVDLGGFSAWLRKGDRQMQRGAVRPRTIETYISILKNHLDCIPASEADIDAINRKLLDADMYQLGIGVRLYCRYMRFSKDALDRIVTPKQRKSKVKFVTKEELREIFDKFGTIGDIPCVGKEDKPGLEVLLHFMYETGGRINEILNIRFRDVSFVKDGQVDGYTVHLFELTPDIIKRGKHRDVMISESTMALLKSYMGTAVGQNSDRYIFGFVNDKDTSAMSEAERLNYRKLLINRMNLVMRHIGKRLIAKPITSHWFRHSIFTHMAMAGVDINRIKSYAGHNSILTTEKYIHAAQTMGKAAFGDWQSKKRDDL